MHNDDGVRLVRHTLFRLKTTQRSVIKSLPRFKTRCLTVCDIDKRFDEFHFHSTEHSDEFTI